MSKHVARVAVLFVLTVAVWTLQGPAASHTPTVYNVVWTW